MKSHTARMASTETAVFVALKRWFASLMMAPFHLKLVASSRSAG